MKRKYIKPITFQDEAMPSEMLSTSNNRINSGKGIGFGGADYDGNCEADVKESGFWEDDFFK